MTSEKDFRKIGFPGGFTVLMAVYGKDDPDLFSRALAGIDANTYQPDQIVLVVDGPVSSAIEEHVGRYERRHDTKIIRLGSNHGLATALNAGLSQIETDWVVRADADDFSLPERFWRLAELICERGGPDLVGSAILEIERDGAAIGRRVVPLSHEAIVRFLLHRNPFNHTSVAYRRSFVAACGGYPRINLFEDYALWAVMIKRGARCANHQDALVYVTAGGDMYRRRGGLRYVRSEFELQAHMAGIGLKSPVRARMDGLLRACVFLAPRRIRGEVYKRFLRTA